jgi:hypothetical protein
MGKDLQTDYADLKAHIAKLTPERRRELSDLIGIDLGKALDELESDIALSKQHRSKSETR